MSKYTLVMTRRDNNRTETSEHISESAALLEASKKLLQASGAGFMMYTNAKCTNIGDVVLWQINIQ